MLIWIPVSGRAFFANWTRKPMKHVGVRRRVSLQVARPECFRFFRQFRFARNLKVNSSDSNFSFLKPSLKRSENFLCRKASLGSTQVTRAQSRRYMSIGLIRCTLDGTFAFIKKLFSFRCKEAFREGKLELSGRLFAEWTSGKMQMSTKPLLASAGTCRLEANSETNF